MKRRKRAMLYLEGNPIYFEIFYSILRGNCKITALEKDLKKHHKTIAEQLEKLIKEGFIVKAGHKRKSVSYKCNYKKFFNQICELLVSSAHSVNDEIVYEKYNPALDLIMPEFRKGEPDKKIIARAKEMENNAFLKSLVFTYLDYFFVKRKKRHAEIDLRSLSDFEMIDLGNVSVDFFRWWDLSRSKSTFKKSFSVLQNSKFEKDYASFCELYDDLNALSKVNKWTDEQKGYFTKVSADVLKGHR